MKKIRVRSRQLVIVSVLASVLLAISGCGLMHRPTLQQGNVVTQKMIDQLRPGMTREQVAFVMGKPVIQNTFNADRWDYVYTRKIRGVQRPNNVVSLFFANDRLSFFVGHLAPKGSTRQGSANPTD